MNQPPNPTCTWARFAGPRLLTVLLLFAVLLLAYIPVLRGGYIWDDDAFVTDNPVLREGWDGLRRIWFEFRATDQYYPMAYSSFWLEYRFWGPSATGSHIVNVLLHGLNAVLLWKTLRVLRVPGAWLATFVFALHPVEVESVGWITERKNVLSASFYFLAALAYFRFQPLLEPGATPAARAWRYYPLIVLFFLGALWSKTVTCSLPAALLIVTWWKQERVRWRDVVPLLPLFVLGAGLGLLTAWMEKNVIGAKGNDWSVPTAQRFLIAGRALWFYLGKLAWPEHLAFFYPRWQLDAGVWWQWLFPAAAAVAGAGLWVARQRIGKGPLAAALYFAVTLFPALGFIDVYPFRYSFVADHFQYLASIGPLALAAAGCTLILPLFRPGVSWLAPLLVGVLLGALGLQTWRQSGMYKDIQTFYLTAIERNPACWLAHDNLAFILLQQGQTDASMTHVHQALALKPDDSEANVNLGNVLMVKGRLAEAAVHYEKALEIRPAFPEAHSDLGNVLLFEGRPADAIAHYQAALAGKPNYAEAHNNLGYALLQIGQLPAAILQFQQALQIRPAYDQARVNLRDARARQQQLSSGL